ncbi:MAG: AAA family ATPase, partial [Acidaminococcaceae bacterium]|nr:AAA family ATPase [Acidaminococcaceae bacterium]
MKKYLREYYYRQIEGFLRSDMIKVITGIRRCGKSSFLESVMDKLISDGIDSKDIIYLPLDKKKKKNISTPEQL